MSNQDRDDSRGARVARIGSLGCVTMVVVTLVALAMGVLYLRRLYDQHMREVEEVMAAMEAVKAGSSEPGTGTGTDLAVHAIARKYEWHFHYPGDDGAFGKTSLEAMSSTNPAGLDLNDASAQDDLVTRELVLPCGSKVQVATRSADVIHALGNLHGDFTLDATPGVNGQALLQTPGSPTSGTLRCVQLCGAGHKNHHAQYQFVAPEEFEKWLKAQPTVEVSKAETLPEPTNR